MVKVSKKTLRDYSSKNVGRSFDMGARDDFDGRKLMDELTSNTYHFVYLNPSAHHK